MAKPRLVPINDMPMGQWFLWGYPNVSQRPYRVVLDQKTGERLIMYPDGWLYRNFLNGSGIPIDGPDTDFEAAYREATRNPRISELEPGTRFRWRGVEWMKLARAEYDSLEEGTYNPVVALTARSRSQPAFMVDGFTGTDPIVDEVL